MKHIQALGNISVWYDLLCGHTGTLYRGIAIRAFDNHTIIIPPIKKLFNQFHPLRLWQSYLMFRLLAADAALAVSIVPGMIQYDRTVAEQSALTRSSQVFSPHQPVFTKPRFSSSIELSSAMVSAGRVFSIRFRRAVLRAPSEWPPAGFEPPRRSRLPGTKVLFRSNG
jgi:hypothetical protein